MSLSFVRRLFGDSINGWRRSGPLPWAFAYFFFLLTGYYVLRPVRDAFGATGNLQYLFTGTFIAMLLLQPLYGALVSRWPRRVFLPAVYALFIACLLGFRWAFARGLSWSGDVFFIWVAVFNLFAVSVFWSFMGDVFHDAEARRVYGYIGAGGTLGGFLGPLISRFLVEAVGVANVLLVSVLMLTLCLYCITRLHPYALARERDARPLAANFNTAMGGDFLAGVRLIREQPMLRALALFMFFGVGVGTLLYNEQAAIARTLGDAEARTRYYAGIDLAINTVTLIVQFLLIRRLLTRFGVAPLLLLPPLLVLIGFAALTASPTPLLVALVQIATRAGEFSLLKPTRETLYTRVAIDARYKAKAMIDTAIYRGADLTFVWLHRLLAGIGSVAVFSVGTAIAAGLCASAWWVGRTQEKVREIPRLHETTA